IAYASICLGHLAVSMHANGRGCTLLLLPKYADAVSESIVRPVPYSVVPPYTELAELMREEEGEMGRRQWQEAFRQAVDLIGGLTAVDGAALVTDRYELLAFGAKIVRRRGGAQVEQVVVTEPVLGDLASVV